MMPGGQHITRLDIRESLKTFYMYHKLGPTQTTTQVSKWNPQEKKGGGWEEIKQTHNTNHQCHWFDHVFHHFNP